MVKRRGKDVACTASNDERKIARLRGKVRVVYHPHARFRAFRFSKWKIGADIKNVIHMDKACISVARCDDCVFAALIQPTIRAQTNVTRVRSATAKTRGKPVAVARETCAFSGIAKSRRKVRNSECIRVSTCIDETLKKRIVISKDFKMKNMPALLTYE